MFMQIAILSHEEKRELTTQFCIAYCGILTKHKLIAAGSIGNALVEATGLEVETLLPPEHGGVEQIASMIAYNEIDLLFFIRSTNETDNFYRSEGENEILRLCDTYNVPFATNLATAEALVMALDRGDLDFRMLIK